MGSRFKSALRVQCMFGVTQPNALSPHPPSTSKTGTFDLSNKTDAPSQNFPAQHQFRVPSFLPEYPIQFPPLHSISSKSHSQTCLPYPVHFIVSKPSNYLSVIAPRSWTVATAGQPAKSFTRARFHLYNGRNGHPGEDSSGNEDSQVENNQKVKVSAEPKKTSAEVETSSKILESKRTPKADGKQAIQESTSKGQMKDNGPGPL